MSIGPRLEAVLQSRLSCGSPIGPVASSVRRPPTVVVAGADSDEIIGCIGSTLALGIARFILVGRVDQTHELADRAGVDLSACDFEKIASREDASAAAARIAAAGDADVIMKGQVQTSDFIRAILSRDHGLLDNGGLISHVSLFDVPGYHKLLMLTDAAITIAPDVEQKLALIANAMPVAAAIGLRKPKVACIAPVERVTEKVRSTVDAAEVVRRVNADGSLGILIDGPFGLDVAVSRDAARIKKIDGDVAGDADLLLMPNLDAGNAVYKSLSFLAAAAVSGIVVGARIPVVLTSRADSEATKFASVRLAIAVSQ